VAGSSGKCHVTARCPLRSQQAISTSWSAWRGLLEAPLIAPDCILIAPDCLPHQVALLEHEHHPVIFTFTQIKSIILNIWAKTDQSAGGAGADDGDDHTGSNSTSRNARLFTALVLSAIPEASASDLLDLDLDDLGASEREIWDPEEPSEEPTLPRPQNPCLMALRLAGSCEAATRRFVNDRLRVARLREAELIFEFVASGLLHVAARDAINAEAAKGYNPWQMGKKKIMPRVARDLYVTDSVDYAAEHDCKVFVSQPLVYEHLHEIFWPSVQPGGGDDLGLGWFQIACLVVFNLVALPLLPFVPKAWEKRLEQFFRDTTANGTPVLLFWLLPSGRFLLWMLAMVCLANLVTTVPPLPLHFELYDLGLILYLAGIIKGELTEMHGDVRTYGDLRRYVTDAFNVLDMLLVILLGTLITARHVHVIDPTLPFAYAELPAQALLALVAWLRLLQILFIFSKSGPLLLMAIRMLEDLWQFIMLASIIVIAFACAFYVLLMNERAVSLHDGTVDLTDDAAEVANVWSVLGLLIESLMKGEPDHIMERTETHVAFAWVFMALFGVIVVLLLLNLLIARFAKTFDMVYENVDSNFKVAFARVVVEARKKELLPPPLNLISAIISVLYDLCERGFASDFCRCFQCMLWPLRWLLYKHCPGGDEDEARHQRLVEEVERRNEREDEARHQRLVEEAERRGERESGGAEGATAPITAPITMAEGHPNMEGAAVEEAIEEDSKAEDEKWVALEVKKYLDKALEEKQGLRGTLLDQVVRFVTVRWFDIGREEQWRTDMTRQIGQVELLLRKVAVQSSTRLDEDMLVRRIGAMLQEKLQEKRPEKRPEELQKL